MRRFNRCSYCLRALWLVGIVVVFMGIGGARGEGEESIIAIESVTSGTVERVGLDSVIGQLSVKDADVREVVQRIAVETGVNILIHPALRGTVTVDLRDVNVRDALRAILKTVDFSFEIIEDCPPTEAPAKQQ